MLPQVLVSLTASALRVVDDRVAQEVHSFEVTRVAEGLDVYHSVSCGSCDGGCYVCEGKGLGEQSYTIPDNAETVAWTRAQVARFCSFGWTVHELFDGFSAKEVA